MIRVVKWNWCEAGRMLQAQEADLYERWFETI
jgi:hypothetical protein